MCHDLKGQQTLCANSTIPIIGVPSKNDLLYGMQLFICIHIHVSMQVLQTFKVDNVEHSLNLLFVVLGQITVFQILCTRMIFH